MNYEYPLNRNRLRIEQEELLLKLALFHYLERENDRLRAGMREQPDLPEDRESAEHAVDRACGGSAGRSSGKRPGRSPGGWLPGRRWCSLPFSSV